MASKVAGKFEPSARLTPANAITGVRILASPVMIILVLRVGVSWVTVVAWVAVASTDFLDGWVARRQGVTTSGAFLDPLADKFLVLGAMAALAAKGLFPWLPIGLIAGREVVVSLFRSWVARRGVSVPARPLAKAKTALQDLAVGLVLLPLTGHGHLWAGRTALWGAVGLALISGAQYLIDSRRPAAGPAAIIGPETRNGMIGGPVLEDRTFDDLAGA